VEFLKMIIKGKLITILGVIAFIIILFIVIIYIIIDSKTKNEIINERGAAEKQRTEGNQ